MPLAESEDPLAELVAWAGGGGGVTPDPATTNEKTSVAGGSVPLLAVNVMGYVPAVPAVGVPEIVAVPSPLSVKVTPLGSSPVSESFGGFGASVCTVNDPAVPVVNAVVEFDVKRMMSKLYLSFVVTPLVAP